MVQLVLSRDGRIELKAFCVWVQLGPWPLRYQSAYSIANEYSTNLFALIVIVYYWIVNKNEVCIFRGLDSFFWVSLCTVWLLSLVCNKLAWKLHDHPLASALRWILLFVWFTEELQKPGFNLLVHNCSCSSSTDFYLEGVSLPSANWRGCRVKIWRHMARKSNFHQICQLN